MQKEVATLVPLPLLTRGQTLQCVGGCGKTQPIGTDDGWLSSCCGNDVMIWDEALDGSDEMECA